MKLSLPGQFTDVIFDNCGLGITADISEERIAEIFQQHEYIFHEIILPTIEVIEDEI